MYIYIYIWAAEVIWYKTQLTGCSYLVLQSRHVLGGLTSFSNAALVFNSQMLYVRCLPRSRGVPTSFYRLIMIFLTNRGTPQYYSLFNQIKSVAQIIQTKQQCHKSDHSGHGAHDQTCGGQPVWRSKCPDGSKTKVGGKQVTSENTWRKTKGLLTVQIRRGPQVILPSHLVQSIQYTRTGDIPWLVGENWIAVIELWVMSYDSWLLN